MGGLTTVKSANAKNPTAVVINRGTRFSRGVNKFPYALYNMESFWTRKRSANLFVSQRGLKPRTTTFGRRDREKVKNDCPTASIEYIGVYRTEARLDNENESAYLRDNKQLYHFLVIVSHHSLLSKLTNY